MFQRVQCNHNFDFLLPTLCIAELNKHQQPVVNKFGYGVNEKYPVAERISEQGFYIPSGLGISLEQIEKVVFKLKKVLGIEQ